MLKDQIMNIILVPSSSGQKAIEEKLTSSCSVKLEPIESYIEEAETWEKEEIKEFADTYIYRYVHRYEDSNHKIDYKSSLIKDVNPEECEEIGEIRKMGESSVCYCIGSEKKMKNEDSPIKQESDLKESVELTPIWRDLNIRVWHTHGIRLKSNVAKFALKSKDIIIVTYNHKRPNETSHAILEYSKYLRKVNPNALIAYLYLNAQSTIDFESRVREENYLETDKKEEKVLIEEVEGKENEYIVEMNVSLGKKCEGNLIRLLDVLIGKNIGQALNSSIGLDDIDKYRSYSSFKIRKSLSFKNTLSSPIPGGNKRHPRVRTYDEESGSFLKRFQEIFCCGTSEKKYRADGDMAV